MAMKPTAQQLNRHLPANGILCRGMITVVLVLLHAVLVRATIVAPPTGDASLGITVRSEAQALGDLILLKDLAVISTTDSRLKSRIGDIAFGGAPKPGREKRLSGRRIASRLKAEKWIPDSAVIRLPAQVLVSRAWQQVSRESLQRLFQDYVASKVRSGEFEVRKFKVRGDLKLPTGRLQLAVSSPARNNLCGSVRVRITARVDGRKCGRITLSGWVDRYEQVVCASRPIPRHAVLSETDIALQRINLSKAPTNLIVHINDAVGSRIKQRLDTGACLRTNMLEIPPLVRKGDRVKLVARGGHLAVSTVGIARKNGAKDDQIPVENITSGKTVTGRVINESTVEVLF